MPLPSDLTTALLSLLACAGADQETWAARAAAVPDWSGLLTLAEKHGVLGFLCERLLSLDGLSRDERSFLGQRRDLERLWSSHLRNSLELVLSTLHDANVPTIALKGPVLAERLYTDPSARRSTDLDLLVAPTDLQRALHILDGLDYRAESGASARYHQRFHHHWGLSHPRRPPLELHFRLYVGFGAAVEAASFFERARPYRTNLGSPCLVLSPADELLYLGLHAAGHDFSRLSWLVDLMLFLQKNSVLDWMLVHERAASLGMSTAFFFGGTVLQDRLDVRVPEFTSGARLGRSRLAVVRRLLAYREALPESSGRGKLLSLILQAALCDRAMSGAWLLQHHLLRVVRRRLQRWLPRVVPLEWSA